VREFINSIVQRHLPESTEEAERSVTAARERLQHEVDELMQKITHSNGVRNGIFRRD
jgi:hypothetical protein